MWAAIRFFVDLIDAADCRCVLVFVVNSAASRNVTFPRDEQFGLCGVYIFLDNSHGREALETATDLVKSMLNPHLNLSSFEWAQAHPNRTYLPPLVTCTQRLLICVEWYIMFVTDSLRVAHLLVNNFSV